jgi:hypothetical protein
VKETEIIWRLFGPKNWRLPAGKQSTRANWLKVKPERWFQKRLSVVFLSSNQLGTNFLGC